MLVNYYDKKSLHDVTYATQLLPIFYNKQLGCVINVQVKFTIEQATKAQRDNRGIALFFL